MATARTASRQNGSRRVSTSDMRDDLESVRSDVDQLIEHLGRYARQELREGFSSTSAVADAVKEKTGESAEKVRSFVNDNPLGACAVAAVAGAVVAMLIRR